jgi:hypothetical protein
VGGFLRKLQDCNTATGWRFGAEFS